MAAAAGGGGRPPHADDSSDEEDEEVHQFKIILLGDGAVGKTSIARRFAFDEFGQQYKQTIGLDFFSNQLTLPGDVKVTVQLWDCGGQSLQSKMLGKYIAGSHAVMLAYDITSVESFENLEDWLAMVRKAFGSRPMPELALVGNKTDQSHIRVVKMANHMEFAKTHGMSSYLVSAKTGDQVQTAFFRLAAKLAGVELSRPDVQVSAKVVQAAIVNHQQNDPTVPNYVITEESAKLQERQRKCVLM